MYFEDIKKRVLYLVSFVLISIFGIEIVLAQYTGPFGYGGGYGYGGIFSYIAVVIRDLLYGIGQIFGAVFGAVAGDYGFIYGRIILWIVLFAILNVAAKNLPFIKNSESPRKTAGIVSGLLSLLGVIFMPYEMVYLITYTYATLLSYFLLGLLFFVILFFLKGESRIVYALRGLVYFTLFFMLSYVMQRFGGGFYI